MWGSLRLTNEYIIQSVGSCIMVSSYFKNCATCTVQLSLNFTYTCGCAWTRFARVKVYNLECIFLARANSSRVQVKLTINHTWCITEFLVTGARLPSNIRGALLYQLGTGGCIQKAKPVQGVYPKPRSLRN